MIKKIVSLLLLFVLIVFIFMQLNKNNPEAIIKSLKLHNALFLNANSMKFDINYLDILPLGKTELREWGDTIYKDRLVYHLTAKAKVSKVVSFFFNVSAELSSYIDKEKLYSLRFTQSLIIPDKPKDEKEVVYDQEKNIMELRGVKRQILPNTQDFLSAFFFIRQQPFELGKEFDLNINTNQKNYRFYAKVVDRKEYNIKGQKIGVWVLKADIRRRDKSPRHSSSAKMWFLDNQTKTPILIKAATNIGSITTRLVSVE
jgi:hypothetical protein